MAIHVRNVGHSASIVTNIAPNVRINAASLIVNTAAAAMNFALIVADAQNAVTLSVPNAVNVMFALEDPTGTKTN